VRADLDAAHQTLSPDLALFEAPFLSLSLSDGLADYPVDGADYATCRWEGQYMYAIVGVYGAAL